MPQSMQVLNDSGAVILAAAMGFMVFAVLECYAAPTGTLLPTLWDNLSVPSSVQETFVTNY
jgi:amino acid permease